MKAYISMPISGMNIELRKAHAEKIEKLLHDQGLDEVVTPFNIEGYEPDKKWEWYMVRDLKVIESCDVVIMTSGWKDSTGCRLEYEHAVMCGKKIICSKDELLKEVC